ncbi:MAG: PadR family transcriptional regulator [Asticcacaulis sp.]
MLLSLIAQKPSHGYELIKAFEEQLEGVYSPSPGVVYPTLTWIEELGYATLSISDDGRKLYTITDAGRAFLEENAEAAQTAFARIENAKKLGAERPAQITRAVQNLRTALHLRLSGAPLTQSQIEAIADIFDKAAKDVERI